MQIRISYVGAIKAGHSRRNWQLPIYRKVALLVLFLFSGWVANGQAMPGSVFEYLTAKEGGKISLEADITALVDNKRSNDYYPATLTLEGGKSFRCELRPRGKFRRRVAEIPPLKIKLSNKMLVAEGFDTLNEIKLVLPYRDDPESDDLIVKEYLAYRMFEMVNPISIRARLIRLTLLDTHIEPSKKSMLAILIEDEEETNKRLGVTGLEKFGLVSDSLMMNQAALVAVFQYMIGNTDWDISMVRNIRMVRAAPTEKIHILPFDFDFSGFVGAPYASPNSDSGLRSVKDRFLMASGLREDAMRRAVLILRNNRAKITELCRNRYLSSEAAEAGISYLETFFDQILYQDSIPGRLILGVTD
jgi:hypothetical protein